MKSNNYESFLRQRQQSKTGKIALYLEYYKGACTMPDGKTKYKREYEHLNLFLYPTPENLTQMKTNADNLSLAQELRTQRELAIKQGKFITGEHNHKSFLQYFYNFIMNKKDGKEFFNWRKVYNMLLEFSGGRLTFDMLNKQFCTSFRDYIINKKSEKTGKKLKPNTAVMYWSKFACVVNKVLADDIILRNPLLAVPSPPQEQTEKIFLTIDELKKLVAADCKNLILKRAFLFACLTGLRFSDVAKLKWQEVQMDNDGGLRIVFSQQKTKGLNHLPLPSQCVDLLGERSEQNAKIFKLVYSKNVSRTLQTWCKLAGIAKKITFHTARHTFAVAQLNLGTGIYVVQRLFGHKNIKSTQVYANIVDETKVLAMSKMPNIIEI